jgi:Type ISP C-terminal specificity domain
VIAFDKEVLEARMKSYFDPNVSFEEMSLINETLVTDAAEFNARGNREALLARSSFQSERLIEHNYRPFDSRWMYWDDTAKLLNRSRPDFFAQVFPGNIFFNTTGKHRRAELWDQLSVSTQFTDLHIHNPDAQVIPLYLRVSDMFSTHLEPNLSPAVLEAMCALTGTTFKPAGPHAPEVLETAEAVFYHAVAVMQSPAYRSENDGYLRQDWPRIPMPKTKTALLESAALGRRVAALLQPGVRVDGVTHKLDAQSQKIAVPIMADGGVIAPGKNLEITVAYGGKGKFVPRGETGTGDLWWSNLGCWSNVPKSAWEFSIGGYPVIKKWLSYRHVNDLGRPLNLDELEFVSEMIRRILALLEMTETLDTNYHALV